MEELADATLRLQRYAERFEQAEHAQLAGAIDRTLTSSRPTAAGFPASRSANSTS